MKLCLLYNSRIKIQDLILTSEHTMSESITMNILKLKEWIGSIQLFDWIFKTLQSTLCIGI